MLALAYKIGKLNSQIEARYSSVPFSEIYGTLSETGKGLPPKRRRGRFGSVALAYRITCGLLSLRWSAIVRSLYEI